MNGSAVDLVDSDVPNGSVDQTDSSPDGFKGEIESVLDLWVGSATLINGLATVDPAPREHHPVADRVSLAAEPFSLRFWDLVDERRSPSHMMEGADHCVARQVELDEVRLVLQIGPAWVVLTSNRTPFGGDLLQSSWFSLGRPTVNELGFTRPPLAWRGDFTQRLWRAATLRPLGSEHRVLV